MRNRQPWFFLSNAALGLSASLAVATAFAAPPAHASAGGAAAKAPPAPAVCWSVTGPFRDRKETYFNATNHCDSARHCQVWVNGSEPPSMVHLEPGTSGRIDVGATESQDKFSSDCAPVGVYGDHND